ncbi:MAG: hypothetical protein KDN22_24020, partial [Verrucomicrobiae bacterium]|nr:hypothetical protein [Verrucomicrobiae bacterium]
AGRGELSLLQRTGGTYVSDHFDAITLRDGFLAIQNLPAGDYSLLLKDAAWEIELRITEGEESNGFLMSDVRNLEHRNPQSMQISEVKSEGDELVVRLINANAYTRVHVFADKFLPAFDAYGTLGKSIDLEPLSGTPARFRNMFVSGRAIGDEYRYIIERRYAKTFPGNMLQRPGLLLNPWAIRSTDTATNDAGKGQDWAQSDGGAGAAMQRPASDSALKRSTGQQDLHAIDFLAQQAVVSYNLAPGDNGEIRIKLANLGDRQYVRVLAVDAADAVERHIALPSRPTEIKDLRLADGLNPKRHYTQRNQVTVLEPGKPFEIQDAGTAAFEAYDSIGSLYRLFKTLGNGDAKLEEFSFITGWAEFEETRKRELYSKYACHELSFFLERKDPEFFASVVQPYLRNKKDKTFLDHYLVGNDLSPWLEAWRFAQLNIVERILLAERLPEQRPSIERNVSDALALLPPEQRLGYWNFDAGLAGSALEFDSFGMEQEGLGLQNRLKSVNRKASRARGAMMLGETAVPELKAAPAAIPAPSNEPGADLYFAKKAEAADKEQLGLTAARRQLRENATLSDEVAEENAVTRDARFAGGRRLADREARQELKQLYRKLDQTREWAENNYYHLLIEQQNADLVTVNKFWNDFAARDPQKPFLSPHLTEAARNFTEMMFALAVLDLPMDGAVKEADVKLDGIKLTMTPSGPVILFHKETEETTASGQATQLLVSQNFFRQGDRYREENGERVDKFVTDEFLTGIVYACQTVVTNPTSTPQRLSLLRQIPLGAIAVNNSKPTDHSDIHLGPYQTQTVEYFFYFPVAGDFAHFPVHVAKGEKVVAFAEPVTLHVVDEPTTTDTTSWAYVSQRGTDEEILRYLSTHNLLRLDLSKVAWRCRESDAFFRRLVALLDSRHFYDDTIYSYGIHHNLPAPMRQYLLHADAFLTQCGSWLDTELVTIDPVERKSYQHLEYSPLVNPRIYSLGGVRKILNDRFREQYLRLMQILARRPALDDTDRMTLTYYLFLQDRIDEALATFAKVNADALPTRLQHDYLRCYAAFYTGDTLLARTVAGQYEAYPVDRWRNLFQEVAAQLDEIDGKTPGLVDDADRSQKQNQLAATDPSFSFKVENRSAELTYRNLKEVVVNYYRMDLEFLFSTNPFVASDTGRFSVIKPNRTDRLTLDPDKDTISIALPGEFDGENVLVEIVGAGTHQAQAYYANTLNVQLARNYGQLQVMNSADGKPVSKAYVKVYAEIAGLPKFYKDGYTDLRGKFDYTSLNTNELDQVSRFSILVMSEANGSLVTETTPPQR